MPESDVFSLQKFKGSRLNENNLSWEDTVTAYYIQTWPCQKVENGSPDMFSKLLTNLIGWKIEYLIVQLRTGFRQKLFRLKTCPQGVLQAQQEKSGFLIFTTSTSACISGTWPLNMFGLILKIDRILLNFFFIDRLLKWPFARDTGWSESGKNKKSWFFLLGLKYTLRTCFQSKKFLLKSFPELSNQVLSFSACQIC